MTDLRADPPITLRRLRDRWPWMMPALVATFVVLAVAAAWELIPWDEAITRWAVDSRTPLRDDVARYVSRLGATPTVVIVTVALAAASWRRCRLLAIAILVVGMARPLTEFAVKEVVGRPRPTGDRLVRGRGPSFPSGHPFATAASWGFLPLVVGLYTRRRVVWWLAAIGVWVLVLMVAATRVWLGVHWASDAVGGILAGVLGVAAVEHVLLGCNGGRAPTSRLGSSGTLE
jgi:undecaprenyl-diphosphatase